MLNDASLEDVIHGWSKRCPEPPVRMPRRGRESHKGDYGRVLLLGGSRGMFGSISLSAISCLKSGAGLVTAAVPDKCVETVASFNPCIMTLPIADDGIGQFASEAEHRLAEISPRFDVIGMGPGMGAGSGCQKLVRRGLTLKKPLVLDADALNVLSESEGWKNAVEASLVVTPHPGEFQRMTGVSAKDRVGQESAAKRLAKEVGCVVLLKGAATYVTDGKRDYHNKTGNPGMASGGSGDCLTGVISALLGQGLDCFQSAMAGAWAHGVAGDLAAAKWGEPGITALEIQEFLPWAVALLEGPMPNVDLGP